MTRGNPLKLIVIFALPLMLGNLCQQLYTMVDSIIVGQGIGIHALAALGSGDWINWMVLAIMMGLCQGFSILFAHSYGANDFDKLRKGIACSIVLCLIIGLILMVIMFNITYPLLILLDTDINVIDMAFSYLKVMYMGILVVMFYNLTSGILRSLGNSFAPLVAMVIASIINIILDYILVIKMHYGVESAAFASVISQGIALLYCLLVLSKVDFVRLKISDFKFDIDIYVELFHLGMPLALMNVIISVGGMAVQKVVNSFGLIFIAGFTVVNKMYGLLEIAATSFGYANSTYVAQNRGAKQYDRIVKGVKVSCVLAVIVSGIIAVTMLIIGRDIISIFVEDSADKQAVIEVAYRYLKMLCYFLWSLYLLYIFRNDLQGIGNTTIPFVSSLVELAMRVCAVMVLPRFLGDLGVFLAEILAWMAAMLLLMVSFIICFRKLRKT